MVFAEADEDNGSQYPTPKADRARFCLSDEEVLELADNAVAIEAHYGRPMDMEWPRTGSTASFISSRLGLRPWPPTTGVTVRDLRARRGGEIVIEADP